jgi:hypothetical protein
MDWMLFLARSLEEGVVRELYLYKIPVLKNCENWGSVKEIGKVEFKGKHSDYRGAIVQYANSYYFLPNARIDALSPFRKWNFKKTLRVLTEEEHKKSQSQTTISTSKKK